jgi:hypothetical protein
MLESLDSVPALGKDRKEGKKGEWEGGKLGRKKFEEFQNKNKVFEKSFSQFEGLNPNVIESL